MNEMNHLVKGGEVENIDFLRLGFRAVKPITRLTSNSLSMAIQVLATHPVSRSYWQLWSFTILLILMGAFKIHAQTGNVCGTPIVITTLPYDDAGNTSTYGDDYANGDVPPLATDAVTTGTGSPYYLTGDDVVYAYTPSGDQVITITTTNDDDWIGLWAFTGCPFASTVGYHTSTSGATRAINDLPVLGGTTYYFVISTWAAPQSTNYTLHIELISAATPCTGTPDPGATTGPENACLGTDFTLSIENVIQENGISYQWETSTDGTTWVTATGSSTGFTYTAMQMEVTWYRCQVSCAGGGTAASTPLQVGLNPPNECYCIPTGAANNEHEIRNFTLGYLNNTSGPSVGTNGYMDYTGIVAPAQLTAGFSYGAALTSGAGSGSHGAAIWIDLNDNGLFEASEKVSSIGNTIQANSTVSFPSFQVANAPGVHRLRVQYTHMQAGISLDPCIINTANSETEDYLVMIIGTGPEDCMGVAGGSALPGTPCTTSNGLDGMWNADCVCEEIVGIAEVGNLMEVSVFPNPASTELFITTPDSKPVHVKVYDAVGHLVMERDVTSKLNVAGLAAGSYSLLISDAQGTIQARSRFMKY